MCLSIKTSHFRVHFFWPSRISVCPLKSKEEASVCPIPTDSKKTTLQFLSIDEFKTRLKTLFFSSI